MNATVSVIYVNQCISLIHNTEEKVNKELLYCASAEAAKFQRVNFIMKIRNIWADIALAGVLSTTVCAKFYLKDTFDSPGDLDSWLHAPGSGKLELSYGEFYADADINLGLRTTTSLTKYAVMRNLERVFDNTEQDKDLIIQYSVKHEQNIDCGGAYLKILSPEVEPEEFGDSTPYSIMFGPDICGMDRKTHLILRDITGESRFMNISVYPKTDQLTHLYTLQLSPTSQSFSILIDREEVATGSLEEMFPNIYPQKMIPDPNARKPADWIDDELIPDPDDKKPLDWVDAEYIADPEAVKPDEWDEEEDGEWEAPLMLNPDFQGHWEPRKIANSEWKGEWKAPLIINPHWTESAQEKTARYRIGAVGIEIWQVRHGTIFDNIIVTYDPEEAEKHAEETFVKLQALEKKIFEEYKAAEIEKMKKEEEERERQESQLRQKLNEAEAMPNDNFVDEVLEEKWKPIKDSIDKEFGFNEEEVKDVDAGIITEKLTKEQLINLGLVDPDDNSADNKANDGIDVTTEKEKPLHEEL